MTDKEKMGNVIKRLRLLKGYSLKEMSQEMEISQSYLSEIENGKKNASLEFINKYALVIKISRHIIIKLGEYDNDLISFIFTRAVEKDIEDLGNYEDFFREKELDL